MKIKKLAFTDDGHYYINGASVTKAEYDRECEKQELKKQLNRIEKKLDKNADFFYFDPEYAQDVKTGEFIHLKTGKKVKLRICPVPKLK